MKQDVLVAGGGPVGLACAIEARMRGLSVTVIEPRSTIIDKACGEGLMPGAVPRLARLGVQPEGFELLGVSYRNGTGSVDHLFRGGSGLGVRRTVLHTALRQRALELGAIIEQATVTGVEQTDRGVRVSVTHRGIANAPIEAHWLLGCDGLHSVVRRLVGLEAAETAHARSRKGAGAKNRRRYGLRRHFAVAPWSRLIEVHWGAHSEIYVTPVSATTVGVAVLGSRTVDFAAEISRIAELAERLRGAEPRSALRGAGPFRQSARARTAGRVLLVGDAAGYIDAITGEGLRLGFAQASAAIECLSRGLPAHYEARWRAETRSFRLLTGSLVWAAQSPLRSAVVPTALALPRVFGAAVERLAR